MDILIAVGGSAVALVAVVGGGVAVMRRGRDRPADRPPDTGATDSAGTGTGTAVADPEAPPADPEAPPADPGLADADVVDGPVTDPTAEAAPGAPEVPELETPESAKGRLVRLRERLATSGSFGRGLLALLSRDTVDEDTWDEIEETLLLADLGPDATDELMETLRTRVRVLGSRTPEAVREILKEELLALVGPDMDRRIASTPLTAESGSRVPAVIMVVGVNGGGKTTTVGKLARVLVAEDRTVVLGAADTFRAAAAEQLTTWGERVGVETLRSEKEGGDPAAVAYDAVHRGVEDDTDVVIVDTAGRLQNKTNLMDELGKVKRVSEKALLGESIQEVLLVLDATTGQNGLQQARVFSEVVDVTGLVLTKLDGTAKGGIVVAVQRELGVPVKLVGLGEGADDLAPFDPNGFVDALLS